MNKQSNKLSLRAYDSHALRKVSTSCNLVKPECVPEKEICDGKDNDCDGNLDEGCDNDLDYFFDWNMECKDNFYSWDFNIAGFNYSKGWHYLEQYNGWAYMGDDLSWLLRLFECGKKDCNDNDYSINPGWAWEKCNNIDDNCNGLIDENLFRNTNQLGLCSKNKQQCILGEWENLGTNYLPRQEICNFLDDDCDGLIDEGLNCNKGCNLNSDCSHLNNQTFYCFNNDVYKKGANFNCISKVCSPSTFNVFFSDCGEDFANETLFCSEDNSSVIKKIVSIDRGCTENLQGGHCFNTTNITTTVYKNCSHGCAKGNCLDECTNGQTRNFSSINYCNGLIILTNKSHEICMNNSWRTIKIPNIFNETCSGKTELENQFCSGENLTKNWSMPSCASGSCTKNFSQIKLFAIMDVMLP